MALTQSEHPRLFLDMIAFVDMAHDKRTYRFYQDTRHGRMLIAESQSVDAIVAAVADYVARRLVERERALAADWRRRRGSRNLGRSRRRQRASRLADRQAARARLAFPPGCRERRRLAPADQPTARPRRGIAPAAWRRVEPVSDASGVDHVRASARGRRLLGLGRRVCATFGLTGSARRRFELRPRVSAAAAVVIIRDERRRAFIPNADLICLAASHDNTSHPITGPALEGRRKIMSNAFFYDLLTSIADRGRSMLKIKPWPKDADKPRRINWSRTAGLWSRAGRGVGGRARRRSPRALSRARSLRPCRVLPRAC